jgi:hypothetical protein
MDRKLSNPLIRSSPSPSHTSAPCAHQASWTTHSRCIFVEAPEEHNASDRLRAGALAQTRTLDTFCACTPLAPPVTIARPPSLAPSLALLLLSVLYKEKIAPRTP